MQELDYDYICYQITQLSTFVSRHYENNKLINTYTYFPLPKDPAELYIDNILSAKKEVSYYITPEHFYFGMIRHNSHLFVLGPIIIYTCPSDFHLKKLAYMLGLSEKNKLESFINTFKYTIALSPNNFFHMLTLINYFINNHRITLDEISLITPSPNTTHPFFKTDYETFTTSLLKQNKDFQKFHSAHRFENTLLGYIKEGDIEKVKNYVSNVYPGALERSTANDLRQLKNTLIITATLISRTAIESGLPIEKSLWMSDKYIQQAEKIQDPQYLLNSLSTMIIEYTECINEIHRFHLTSPLGRKVDEYITEHINEPIKIDMIADSLGITKEYLSTKFKAETGYTLSNYYMRRKITEAKYLLLNTTHTLSSISNYLGFSSQSHFQNVFKKYEGITPGKWKKQH